MNNFKYFCNMKQHEEVTFQTLANNEDIQIGYSDNDIVVVDSIQQFTEVNTAHVAMNAVVICTNGKAAHADTLRNAPDEQYLKSFVDFYLLASAQEIYCAGTEEMYPSEFPLYAAKVNNRPFYRERLS